MGWIVRDSREPVTGVIHEVEADAEDELIDLDAGLQYELTELYIEPTRPTGGRDE